MKSGIYFMTFTIIIGIFSLNAVPASVDEDQKINSVIIRHSVAMPAIRL